MLSWILERLFECEEKLVGLDEVFYQSVFAHMAREAAMRSEFTPKMIDSLDFRKTIYREIFPDRDQFEWYKGADVKIGARIAESSKYIVEAINEKVKQKGILGKVFGRSAKSFLKSFASEDINGSLEKKYEQVRSVADKIYSTGTISM